MASKVTNEDILRINELYYQTHTYAEVARQTGFSASTVKKYVIPGWAPVMQEKVARFSLSDIPHYQLAANLFRGIDNYGTLCTLTNIEKKEIEELWEELAI
jgi:transposase